MYSEECAHNRQVPGFRGGLRCLDCRAYLEQEDADDGEDEAGGPPTYASVNAGHVSTPRRLYYQRRVHEAGDLLFVDTAVREEALKRALTWSDLPGESPGSLIAYAFFDAAADLGVSLDEGQIAAAFDLTVRQMLRVERRLIRVRSRTPEEFLPLVTRQWELTFQEHKRISHFLRSHATALTRVRRSPKSIACAVAFLLTQPQQIASLVTRSEQVGLHKSTVRGALADIKRLSLPQTPQAPTGVTEDALPPPPPPPPAASTCGKTITALG